MVVRSAHGLVARLQRVVALAMRRYDGRITEPVLAWLPHRRAGLFVGISSGAAIADHLGAFPWE